ncbi:DUF3188 domain-containing protein [Sinomonas terrae]|uniref:DUF3188 domain-containing protein n=1 Tax=Sinomonas terrae TaxID=2908838 RepID=A0ABS9TXQ8_9MICC|nr:DUF3188 domain-containing protein [Sinomonas terrae]MCH6469248.1 DUF3188 domain-containing protein [Sinomonas terrae]
MNEFWETAPPLYKKVVLSGMAFLGVGIILNIVANLSHVTWLLYASLVIIGVGLVAHLFGIGIRAREMRRRIRG